MTTEEDLQVEGEGKSVEDKPLSITCALSHVTNANVLFSTYFNFYFWSSDAYVQPDVNCILDESLHLA